MDRHDEAPHAMGESEASGILRAEIDLNAIAHNVRELRRVTKSPSVRFMAVVKANAYGHGAAEVARKALESGADMLGVARLGEGIQIREAGICAPILIFGHTPADYAGKLCDHDLTQTVHTCESAGALSDFALSRGKKIRVHIKVDTGMGRLGMVAVADHLIKRRIIAEKQKKLADDILTIAGLHGIETEGIYTHFAASDSSDKSFADRQFAIFTDLLELLHHRGLNIPIRHAANSGAIIDLPETHLDMVRAGVAIYGLYPSDEVDKTRVSLRPAMCLKAGVVHLKKVPAGFSVSYGMTWKTPNPTVIATVPVGYADGFSRLLSSNGHMLVRGHRAPITGRVCMDMTMVDVGHIPDVRTGDEVVIIGPQGDAEITADEIASSVGTINYEVVSSVMARVPRLWLR